MMRAWRMWATPATALCNATSLSSRSSPELVRQPLFIRRNYARQVKARTFASESKAPSEPMGLKAGAKEGLHLSPNMKLMAAYVVIAFGAIGLVAKYKNEGDDREQTARTFNLAKRAIAKDRRVFDAVGYPSSFEKCHDDDEQSHEGSFRITGDKGSALVFYRQPLEPSISETNNLAFDRLDVEVADGSSFSALESYLQDENVQTQQKATSLGKKLLLPMTGGLLIGGVASFLVIRILRNRPSYVHKLVLDHVNNSKIATEYLGNPIKSDRKSFRGELSNSNAKFSIACNGPMGSGRLFVNAFKKASPEAKAEGVMTSPGTSWKFDTLTLSIERNARRKDRGKGKTINLLQK